MWSYRLALLVFPARSISLLWPQSAFIRHPSLRPWALNLHIQLTLEDWAAAGWAMAPLAQSVRLSHLQACPAMVTLTKTILNHFISGSPVLRSRTPLHTRSTVPSTKGLGARSPGPGLPWPVWFLESHPTGTHGHLTTWLWLTSSLAWHLKRLQSEIPWAPSVFSCL